MRTSTPTSAGRSSATLGRSRATLGRSSAVLLIAMAAIATSPLPTSLIGAAHAQEMLGGTSDYVLGPSDTVRITIAEWVPREGSARDWSAVNGEYTVSAGGTVSIPFVGALDVRALTALELAERIGPALRVRLGLEDEPSASVEVVAHRPFFVSGQVNAPGMYPFVPDLTVAKAIAIAGGVGTPGRDGGNEPDRTRIQATGALGQLAAESVGLLAREARLRAELAGTDAIDFPPAVRGAPGADELMRNEETIAAEREGAMQRRLTNLDQLKLLLESELTSLEARVASQEEQARLARQEASDVGDLRQRGLAVAARAREIERIAAEAASSVLTLRTEMLRVRQDLNRAERDREAFLSERRTELAAELQEIAVRLDVIERRASMNRELAASALAGAGTAEPAPVFAFEYAVRRGTGADERRLTLVPGDPLLPGDVLEVGLVAPAIQ